MSDAPHVSDPTFWQGHYDRDHTPWDLGEVAPPLGRALAGGAFPAGARIAVPGCGRGHDALALAARGHDVVGYDFAAPAVEAARSAARERGLTTARFEQRDIFELLPEERGGFQGVLEHTCFCAIHPSRRADYVELAHGLLVPGGRLLALFFPVGKARDEGPPYGLSRDEIEAVFAPRFRVLSMEIPADSTPDRAGKEWLTLLEATG